MRKNIIYTKVLTTNEGNIMVSLIFWGQMMLIIEHVNDPTTGSHLYTSQFKFSKGLTSMGREGDRCHSIWVYPIYLYTKMLRIFFFLPKVKNKNSTTIWSSNIIIQISKSFPYVSKPMEFFFILLQVPLFLKKYRLKSSNFLWP